MLDLTLAVAHHLLIFGLFGVLFAEMISVREGMTIEAVTAFRGSICRTASSRG